MLEQASHPVLFESAKLDTAANNAKQYGEDRHGYQQAQISAEASIDIIAANPVALFTPEQYTPARFAKTIADACEKFLTAPSTHEQTNSDKQPPFKGGAIGLVSYSGAAACIGIAKATRKLPFAALVGIYQWVIVRNHRDQSCCLVADNKITQATWLELCETFTQQLDLLHTTQNEKIFALTGQWQCSFSKASYEQKFSRVQDYIRAGDSYQINLSREFSAPYKGSTFVAYQQLRRSIPAPFAGLLKSGGKTMISLSPERFIRIENGIVSTQPIKGTRQRSENPEQDSAAIDELEKSAKDRSENLMIVDLMRNDIGKHCLPGSVKVPKLFDIHSFSNVHHMVSTVQGKLKNNSLYEALNCFFDVMPGGSITGAPKIRAIQIIDELEPHDRSIYCGCFFYAGMDGRLDSNILIRSLLFKQDEPEELEREQADYTDTSDESHSETGAVYCWGGSGLVADSDLESEYAETYYKISHILDALTGK